MYGYRRLSIKPWIQLQVILEMCKPPAAEPKTWPMTDMTIMPFFSHFRIKALKLPQGLQICMDQPEVTLRPRDKLKMSTFTQLLIRTLSQNKERQCQNTQCTAEAFPIEKKGGQAKEQTHGLLISARQMREGKIGGREGNTNLITEQMLSIQEIISHVTLTSRLHHLALFQ